MSKHTIKRSTVITRLKRHLQKTGRSCNFYRSTDTYVVARGDAVQYAGTLQEVAA